MIKLLQLCFVLLIFFSCSSKKRVIEAKGKEVTTTTVKLIDTVTKTEKKAKDSIIEKSEIVIEETIPEHDTWDALLLKYVSSTGKVNYKGFLKSRKELLHYINELNNNKPNNDWTKSDKLAYWINAYNAFTIDLILRHYPLKNIKDIKNPWEQRHWKLGNKWYNLNEIEHKILRKMDEPRIHFAIVCASVSCPKLLNTAFTSENLETQLTKVTKEFLDDSSKNNLSENHIKLSKIFQWFAKDFKHDGSLIDFLNKYSNVKISAKAKKSFNDYNWDLNE